MRDYKEQIEEFNANITSIIDESVRELSMTFDKSTKTSITEIRTTGRYTSAIETVIANRAAV